MDLSNSPARSTRAAAFHRAVWRWHFWAGLVVAPFLLILSATGAIYLFGESIDDALYPNLRFVTPVERPAPPSRMIRAALAAVPGSASRIDLPAAADRPAVVFVAPAGGATTRVFVDPGSARVLGVQVPGDTLVGWADAMHGSLTLGGIGDRVVELAACWTLVLLVTGAILWWPRGRFRAAGTLWPRWHLRGRGFWRSLHGPVGWWTGGLVVFLVLTGLPWAGVQGPLLQQGVNAAGIGYPASYKLNNAPSSRPMGATLGAAPWTLETAPMPVSHADHGAAAGGDAAAIAGSDQVAAWLRGRGLAGGYRLYLPAGPRGVYTAYTSPGRPQGQRTFYLDRYTLAPIGREVRFADYGWAGRAIELGVQVHMGRYFGIANQLLMLLPCVGIWVLVVSGVAMWWRRRPEGRIGAPPPLPGARAWGLVAALAVAGVVLPLFGASLIVLALLDRLASAIRHRAAA